MSKHSPSYKLPDNSTPEDQAAVWTPFCKSGSYWEKIKPSFKRMKQEIQEFLKCYSTQWCGGKLFALKSPSFGTILIVKFPNICKLMTQPKFRHFFQIELEATLCKGNVISSFYR